MKKFTLLFSLGCLTMSATYAQRSNYKIPNAQAEVARTTFVAPPVVDNTRLKPKARTAARTTATTASVFWGPETFGSGTATSLPTGWTADGVPSGSGTWKWANTASTSTFTMGAMASTTASDGWMIFDSDLIGAATGGSPSGWLQSPPITACATEASVRLNFENYFRKFVDSCSIWVSTGPSFSAGTYHVYPVFSNNSLATNISSPNTNTLQINISSTAAMQPIVYIRFMYYGYAGGSYSWMIDDVTLSSMDPVDVAVDKSAAIYWGGSQNGWASFGAKPAKMMDTLFPLSLVTNYGTTSYPTANVNAKIFQGSTSVYDQNTTVNIPVDAVDTIADFTGVGTPPGYFATAAGLYTVPFSVSFASDADITNDKDTAMFRVTDSSWSENTPNSKLVGAQYIYRTSPAPYSFSPGTGFAVKPGRTDTITSISVAFDDTTAVGQVVGVQIFHFNGTDWVYDGATQFRALAASDISTSSTIAYANFASDYVASGGYLVLDGGTDGGTYAAVVKGQGNTSTVAVLTSTEPGPASIIGGAAYSDTSMNDGAATQQFGQTGLPYANSAVPLITLNFGPVPAVGVGNINMNVDFVGKAYPNPANNMVTIPFTLVNENTVTVSLSNVVGQVIATQTVTAVAGASKVSFATGNLPAGVYLYTASVGGRQTTGRVSITH